MIVLSDNGTRIIDLVNDLIPSQGRERMVCI